MQSLPTCLIHDSALLDKLIQTDILGIFNHVEVTSIFATHSSEKRTVNVLTHLVAVERSKLKESPGKPESIRVSGMTDWRFGITQHRVPPKALTEKLNDALQNMRWTEGNCCLSFGKLLHKGHWFAPPAGHLPDAPVNRLLKNNFWNGSHVWEWTAEDKSDFLPFFEKPRLLHALSEGIAEHLPIQLASLSDKLGSLILQLPVTCLVSDYSGRGKVDADVICEVNWHPEVTPRPLVITAERQNDGLLSRTSVQLSGNGEVILPVQYGPGGVKCVINDSEHDVILGAMEVDFIRSVHMGTHVENHEPRTFSVPPRGSKGMTKKESVQVTNVQQSVIGNPNSLAHFGYTQKRIYREEMQVLLDHREFVQYRTDDKAENGQTLSDEQRHLRALKDIRFLIQRHGEKAVWLWDPYLDSTDVLNTLFHSTNVAAKLRALTGAEQSKESKNPNEQKENCLTKPIATFEERVEDGSQATGNPTKKEKFVIEQSEFLKKNVTHLAGLRLEFRARVGNSGFAFHDRFLIFPHADPEPLAWSLGISVNSVGKEHHILQKVPNGRLIADAFQDLWDDLDKPEQLIWKTP